MQRTSFSRSFAAIIGAAVLVSATAAFAFEAKPYDEASFKAGQAAGKHTVVHVTAPWCPTCKAQEKVIDGLAQKPDFKDVTLFKVDYDSQKDALKAFKVNTQSTLIAFNGATETGRVVGDTTAAALAGVFSASMKQ